MSESQPTGRGIYLLPTSITLIGLFAGFYGVVASSKGNFAQAAIAIYIAMIMDMLDGRVARLTNTETKFGAELDSLTDMVTCGIAPALVVYFFSLWSLGKIGWLLSFIYIASVALRLARFNARQQSANKRYFQGLPSPAGAGIMAALVWLAHDNAIYGPNISVIVAIISLFCAIMMVSNVPYRSFKDINMKDSVPLMTIVALCLVFVFVAINPPSILFAGFMLFGLYGPVLKLWSVVRKRFSKS